MTAVLGGFAALGLIVVVGYVLARTQVVGRGAADTVSRVVFHAGVPALMVTTLAGADVAHVFSTAAVVTVSTAVLMALTYAVLGRTLLRSSPAGSILGALSSSYVNAGNLGLPILVLTVGTAAPVVPAMLLQLLVMVPVSFALLDRATGRAGAGWRVFAPVLSPPVLGVLAGIVLSLTGWQLPDVVATPVGMLSDMTVPALLLAFGMSIHGGGEAGDRAPVREVATAVVLKSFVAPLVAWVIGGPVAGLEGDALLGVVAVAALPTAQNVFVYAMRYRTQVDLVRRSILASSALCVPVIVAATGLLQ